MPLTTPIQLLGFLLIGLGLIGSVVPLLPGPLLIWLGALAWAWGNGFADIHWVTLAVLGLLAAMAWGSDLFFTTTLTRRAGVSWKAIGGAILGGILGGIFLSSLPVVGTLFGALLGALLGMLLVEYYDKRDWQAALAGVRAYVAATFLSTLFEVTVSLAMVAIFVWRVLV